MQSFDKSNKKVILYISRFNNYIVTYYNNKLTFESGSNSESVKLIPKGKTTQDHKGMKSCIKLCS